MRPEKEYSRGSGTGGRTRTHAHGLTESEKWAAIVPRRAVAAADWIPRSVRGPSKKRLRKSDLMASLEGPAAGAEPDL
ncbi:unnamed protein product [Ixodes pacificus]